MGRGREVCFFLRAGRAAAPHPRLGSRGGGAAGDGGGTTLPGGCIIAHTRIDLVGRIGTAILNGLLPPAGTGPGPA
ncbi:hypothetical protein F0344_34995 (plasmid) [Streptomyces finlayi]|uniref:Uncharacterized protein n=1 Tax=Streptomyces finlayi TaxID=67296 RepID=A0A7G7BWE5_9ACTN|nr:hypothetical protein [Streptomyces finlayi]QNE79660.1 hypothetical protein F0344_34995 [Streptomyces finlayi]